MLYFEPMFILGLNKFFKAVIISNRMYLLFNTKELTVNNNLLGGIK